MSEYKRRRAAQVHPPYPDVQEPECEGHDAARPAVPVPAAGLLYEDRGPLRRWSDPNDPLGGSQVSAEVHGALRRLRGHGDTLPAGTATAMSEAMGADLGNVRIHTGAEPARLARSVQARAFTQGTDIYFGGGAYSPHSMSGQHLLAHELAHVVQPDTGEQAGNGPVVGRAADPAEAAADRIADRTLAALRRRATVGADVAGPTIGPSRLARSIDRSARPATLHCPDGAAERPIRRKYEPTIAELMDYSMIPKKWGSSAVSAGAEARAKSWCRDHKQFLSLVNNFSWDEFQALMKKYPVKVGGGAKVPTKAADIRTHMQKEMAAEVKAIAVAKAEAVEAQIESFRLKGEPGAGKSLAAYLKDGSMTVEHHSTFRTDDEKANKEPKGQGPYTRNFTVKVKGKNAAWEVHVHYDRNGNVQKAHSKLTKDRYGQQHIKDLNSKGDTVLATTATIDAAIDTAARTKPDF